MRPAKRIARRAAAAVLLAAGCAPLSGSTPDRPASGVGPGSASAAPGTYAYAVQTRAPHLCQSSAPSFFGERDHFEVYVEGEDFEASSRDAEDSPIGGIGSHFARLDGVGFGWYDGGGVSPVIGGDSPVIGEIRLRDYNRAYEQLMHHPPPRWESIFIFVEPAPHDSCAPTARRPIALPEREHRDITDLLVNQQQQYFDQAVAALAKLPFTPLLPDSSLAKRFGYTDGGASRAGYGIRYANWGMPDGDSSELHIGFTVHSADAPASRCMKTWPAQKCALLFTTRRGYEVFRDFEHSAGSSSDPSLPNYYVKVGAALVHLSYPHWKPGPDGMPEFRAHEFAPGELEAIFDSLREAKPEDLGCRG